MKGKGGRSCMKFCWHGRSPCDCPCSDHLKADCPYDKLVKENNEKEDKLRKNKGKEDELRRSKEKEDKGKGNVEVCRAWLLEPMGTYLKTGEGSNSLEEEFANFCARLQLRKKRVRGGEG